MTLLAALTAALAATGLVVVVHAWTTPPPPDSETDLRSRLDQARTSARHITPSRVLVSVVVPAAVWVWTGWPAAMLIGVVAIWVALNGRDRREATQLHEQRGQAVEAWAVLVRDGIAGGAGLSQAMTAAARQADRILKPEMQRFRSTLQSSTQEQALLQLQDDLDHPDATMVIVAMLHAARTEAQGIAALLDRLTFTIRRKTAMRENVETSRTSILTDARTVTIVFGAFAALAVLFARDLLAVYDSPTGQLALLGLAGMFGLARLSMSRMASMALVAQVRLRRDTATGEATR